MIRPVRIVERDDIVSTHQIQVVDLIREAWITRDHVNIVEAVPECDLPAVVVSLNEMIERIVAFVRRIIVVSITSLPLSVGVQLTIQPTIDKTISSVTIGCTSIRNIP